MKKTICFILLTIHFLSICVFSVNAEDNSKITERLAQEISNNTDESISLYVALKPVVSEAEVEKIISEKYTWSTEKEHKKYYREELSSIVSDYIQEFANENESLFEKVLVQGKGSEYIIADVKKENINLLAAQDAVLELDYWENMDVEPADGLFVEEFEQWSIEKFGDNCLTDGYSYDELYCHYSGEEPDWMLVKADYFSPQATAETWLQVGGIGGRTVFGLTIGEPFMTGYGVYDVKENKFYGLEEMADNYSDYVFEINVPKVDYSKYEGVIDVLADLNIGYMFGDVNNDKALDVLDALEIQKAAVGKAGLDGYDYTMCNDIRLIADVNGDYSVDVLDAVEIQKAVVAE